MDLLPIVAIRLREAREEKKLSQERLGRLAGIDEFSASARMNQYERGKHTPDYGTMQRIAAALELPVAYFYADTEEDAQLLRLFHRLAQNNRAKLLAYAETLRDGPSART